MPDNYYQQLKAAGLCPGCKAAVIGRVYCLACYTRQHSYTSTRRRNNRDRYAELVAAGVCIYCRTKPCTATRACDECRTRERSRKRGGRPSSRPNWLCSTCKLPGHYSRSCPDRLKADFVQIVTTRKNETY